MRARSAAMPTSSTSPRIDANTGAAGDQAFAFLGQRTDAQGLAAGPASIWVRNVAGGDTLVRANNDGDATIELTLRIADGGPPSRPTTSAETSSSDAAGARGRPSPRARPETSDADKRRHHLLAPGLRVGHSRGGRVSLARPEAHWRSPPRTPPPNPDDPSDTLLEFPDNRLLIDLCGELDRNIVQIESRLGVAIHRRGNHLALHGPAPRARGGRAGAARRSTRGWSRGGR